MRTTTVGVITRAPVPGRSKGRLLTAYGDAWVAGLHAAMLRDTLDGLQSVRADGYLVFAAGPADDDPHAPAALDVLARHVPAPWELVDARGDRRHARVEHALSTMFSRGAEVAVLSSADAPAWPVDSLAAATEADGLGGYDVIVGPSEEGRCCLVVVRALERAVVAELAGLPCETEGGVESVRARCATLGLELRELPPCHEVRVPEDVARLIDELRRHPERAPRTAQYLVTHA